MSPVLQGYGSGGGNECGRICSKIAPIWRVFVAFRPRLFRPEPRGARAGVAAVPAVSVCAFAFTETAGAGISASVGAESAGPRYRTSRGAGSFLRCSSRRVHQAHGKARKQRARMGTPKPRRRCIPPEGRRDFHRKAGTGEPVGITEARRSSAYLTAVGETEAAPEGAHTFMLFWWASYPRFASRQTLRFYCVTQRRGLQAQAR